MLKTQAKQHLNHVKNRLTDQHVNLAVTGLSGSGKTAFITSLVNQLLHASEEHQLPFFSVQREGRLIGAKIDLQPNLNISRFSYESGIKQLYGEPPAWPTPTRGVSQVRLRLRYRSNLNYKKVFNQFNTLTLDITDYPGEWLLDLPMLKLSFKEWCEQCWSEMQSPIKRAMADEFLKASEGIRWSEAIDEQQIAKLSQAYTKLLFDFKESGYEVIQPGRFVLPGELAGAPVLQFVPVNPEYFDNDKLAENSALHIVSERYEHYKKTVIKPFYKDHFRRFDRQIVLVDLLSALNSGEHSFIDLGNAVHDLMDSFDYGQASILKRLFKPKIDKLLFAASKVDHITQEQQPNLIQLLQSVITQKRRQIQFDGVETESTALAAIRACQFGSVVKGQDKTPVIKGTSLDSESVLIFPGDVPSVCPDKQFWQSQGFEFPRLRPLSMPKGLACPHIRVDQALEFLLGDKLR
ncbi:YcjX family protein [Alteromonadaceae bacterium M269]|nr:YcjX family protein [Alteromonadaceae bacterium M269]